MKRRGKAGGKVTKTQRRKSLRRHTTTKVAGRREPSAVDATERIALLEPVNGFSKAKQAIDAEMPKMAGWVLHDIRRTVRTHLSALPVPDLVRELVIGHTKPGLHKVYDQHAYVAEKRHALALWAARLREIVEPAPANVVKLGRRR